MVGEKPSLDQCLAWRKREHSHSGEAGILQQLAEGEAEVVHKSVTAEAKGLWTMAKSE